MNYELKVCKIALLTFGHKADDSVRVVQRRVAFLHDVAHSSSRGPVPVHVSVPIPILGQHGPVQLHHKERGPGLVLPMVRTSVLGVTSTE